VAYIKNLEKTLEKLEKQKQERVQCVSTFGCEPSMFVTGQGSSNNNISNAIIGTTSNALSFPVAFDKTWASSNLVLNIFGDEAQFSICTAHKPGLMTTIGFVLEKYKIEVITANISCIGYGNACMIQAHVSLKLNPPPYIFSYYACFVDFIFNSKLLLSRLFLIQSNK